MILSSCRIFHGAYDLSGDVNTLSLDLSADLQDVTNFNSGGWTSVEPGMKTGEFSYEGYFRTGTLQIDSHLTNELGVTGRPLTLATSSADGVTAYFTQSATSNVNILNGAVGDVGKVSASGSATNDVLQGTILLPSAARTTTATGTGRQLGAVSATQALYANLHVFAASGTTPTLSVVVQSATSNAFASPTSRITFTTATGATSEARVVNGAITDTWWRISYTITGTTPSFTFAVVAGIGLI